MGEDQLSLVPMDFNRPIRIRDRPEKLPGGAGVLAIRQIDHRLNVIDWLARRTVGASCPFETPSLSSPSAIRTLCARADGADKDDNY